MMCSVFLPVVPDWALATPGVIVAAATTPIASAIATSVRFTVMVPPWWLRQGATAHLSHRRCNYARFRRSVTVNESDSYHPAMRSSETDYLVVGAGAMGMAFTDALIDHA